ncbi:hypothetical protein ACJOS4_34605, partial [Nocardiopsis sp. frass3]
MPDVICHGGGELSESRNGANGADGQRPELDEDIAPETNDTSAEELSDAGEDTTGGAPSTGGGEDAGSASDSGPITFKTSGTFFRERVAQVLAEQGFDSEEEGTAPEPAAEPVTEALPEVTGTSATDKPETASAEAEKDTSTGAAAEPATPSSGGEDDTTVPATPAAEAAEPAAESWFTPKASQESQQPPQASRPESA